MKRWAFIWGALIASLAALIGLGGAEFRLPVLVGRFRLETLEAIVANKAMSLVVVTLGLLVRLPTVPIGSVAAHWDILANLLAGTLIGAWWAAGHVMRWPRVLLDRIVAGLLVAIALLLLGEHWLPIGAHAGVPPGAVRIVLGLVLGFGIGTVAAVLGVAGGELLIPTLVLLFGSDIKLAGTLSLVISLPTMIVSFTRYRQSPAFAVLARQRTLLLWMTLGSIAGAIVGGLLLNRVPTDWLVVLLGVVLLVSAVKIFALAKPPL